MATYRAKEEIWLSDQCIKVKQGKEFEAVFPAGFDFGDKIELVVKHDQDALKIRKKRVEK